ncbi:hypothetical protein C493_15483 [Natronolimnohabitans innermongolicus JCM 12255]|uniref:Uncharacterized protein n=1 Tax=Natronolimnohabitans innermongolicus JCM 12255 TaxID=1227499 RepID=L9WU96_9EURY|nr:hypothetical protein C493_15483 [Natronolimnohabitans innermongolicus JCM 12255]
MISSLCPECDGFGEQIAKRAADGKTVFDFECTDCGHEWSLTL